MERKEGDERMRREERRKGGVGVERNRKRGEDKEERRRRGEGGEGEEMHIHNNVHILQIIMKVEIWIL